MGALLTLEEVKRAAKREDFRAGVQMRLLTPRLSVRVTRWIVAHARVSPNQITLVSLTVGLAAAACFTAASPLVVALGLAGYHLHILLDYVDGEVARCRGETSTRGAYFDLVTDRVTYPLFVWASALGAARVAGDPSLLVAGFVAAFGLLLDKAAVDCWYRANAGATALEDRYVVAPVRSARRRWRARGALALVMSRGLTAFVTYTTLAAAMDSTRLLGASGLRALVVWVFAVVMPLGALVRFLYVYRHGEIPRRQQLL